MGIRDNRASFSNPRWAVSTGETLDPNAVEPPGPQKDTGWVPGVDVPVGEWWNWLHQQASIFFGYIESVWAKRWTVNSLLRSGKGTTSGQVSAGAGLSVNVALGRFWIEGAMYEIAAATNLALAAADPTNPRYDIIVAKVVGGVPSYDKVTGTPAASPSEPAISSNMVALARVRVNAAAVTPTSIVDRRIFGSHAMDEGQVDRTFRAGDLGGGDYLLEVDDDVVVGGRVKIAPVAGLVDIGGSTIVVTPATQQVSIEPAGVLLATPVVRKFDLPRAGFTETSDVDRQPIGGQEAFVDTGAVAFVRAPVRIPNGGQIKAVRVYGYRGTNTPGFTTTLLAINKSTGAGTTVATGTNNGAGPTGNFTQQITGFTHTVDQNSVYELTVLWVAASGDLGLRSAEVEWEETTPWNSL